MEVEPGGRPLHPQLAAEGRPALHASPQRLDLSFRLRPIHVIKPVAWPVERPAREQAGPACVTTRLCKRCSSRGIISLGSMRR
jgi:hypothetical protein